jgi:two-component sensor histidine kinase
VIKAGIPDDVDWHDAKSPGLRLVVSLVEQLSGTIELDRSSTEIRVLKFF